MYTTLLTDPWWEHRTVADLDTIADRDAREGWFRDACARTHQSRTCAGSRRRSAATAQRACCSRARLRGDRQALSALVSVFAPQGGLDTLVQPGSAFLRLRVTSTTPRATLDRLRTGSLATVATPDCRGHLREPIGRGRSGRPQDLAASGGVLSALGARLCGYPARRADRRHRWTWTRSDDHLPWAHSESSAAAGPSPPGDLSHLRRFRRGDRDNRHRHRTVDPGHRRSLYSTRQRPTLARYLETTWIARAGDCSRSTRAGSPTSGRSASGSSARRCDEANRTNRVLSAIRRRDGARAHERRGARRDGYSVCHDAGNRPLVGWRTLATDRGNAEADAGASRRAAGRED